MTLSAGVRKDLLKTLKGKKLAYYGYTVGKQGSCLEKEIMQGTMPGARRRVDHAQWMDNIKTWTGLIMEESVRIAEDRDEWRKCFHGVANLGLTTAKEQIRTEVHISQRRRRRTKPWPQRGRVVSEICKWTDKQTDEQRGILITIFCTSPGRDEVKIHVNEHFN